MKKTVANDVLLDALFNIEDNIAAVDSNFTITYVNRAFANNVGLKVSEMLGKNMLTLLPKSKQFIKDKILDSINNQKIVNFEWKGPYSSLFLGTTIFPSDKGAAIISRDVTNITERKKTEEALLQAKVKYEQLVERLPEMVFEISNEGKVIFANSRAFEILGYSKEELENDFDANRLVAPEDAERSRSNMRVMFNGQMHHSNEYTFVKKDGTRFPVLLNSSPVFVENKIVGARGLIIDLTESKNTERQLHAQERLAAIGLTASMVGHDIRNPLQAILSDVYLLKEFLTSIPEQTTKEDVSESLCEIEKNIEYINKIVSDLQDYARPLKPDFASVDISEVMTNVVKGAHVPNNINVDIVSNTFMKIKSDTTFIRRILTNLVNNAIQAMPNGGELELSCFSKGDKLFITVSDTGVGIPDHFKQNVFSPMMTTKSKGQGLGLAVAKRLVEAINGKIDFESESGKGTKFKIELPSS